MYVTEIVRPLARSQLQLQLPQQKQLQLTKQFLHTAATKTAQVPTTETTPATVHSTFPAPNTASLPLQPRHKGLVDRPKGFYGLSQGSYGSIQDLG